MTDPALLVGVGGAVGATLRYAVSQALPAERFPWATLVVNAVGSFALALVAFGGAGRTATLFVGVGACGSFTTFSSFSFAAVDLWERGDRALAALHAGGNLAACLVAVGLAGLLV